MVKNILKQEVADTILALEKHRADNFVRDYPGLAKILSVLLIWTSSRILDFLIFGHWQESLNSRFFCAVRSQRNRFVFFQPAHRENARPNRRASDPRAEHLHSKEANLQFCQQFLIMSFVYHPCFNRWCFKSVSLNVYNFADCSICVREFV